MRTKSHGIQRICLWVLFALLLSPGGLFAGSSFPAPHTPKPSSPYIEYRSPGVYPFSYRGWFDVDIRTDFKIPAGEFDTDVNRERNTPFQPFTREKKVFPYFGPNKLGSVELLNQGGCRLTPDKTVWTPYDLGSLLSFWEWQYEYDWTLVNYWYSVPIAWTTYCWSGGCDSEGKNCWPGGCVTYATDYNNYEVYYWTKGAFLRKVRADRSKAFPVKTTGKYQNPSTGTLVTTKKDFSAPATGEFHRVTPKGLVDIPFEYEGKIMDFTHQWYEFLYKHSLQTITHSLKALVHPLPAENPTWRMDADNVWRETIDDTRVKLTFKWNKPGLNRNEELYYIEYQKLFDGKIKMRDIVKLLSNLGYDQVDVPIYMALESKEPKLYLVTTPQLVKGVRKAPPPYTPIPQSSWLSHAGVVPGYTLHPSAERFGRGYIRECIQPYQFENGKPKAGPVKYIFSQMFDVNGDSRIDSTDRAFLDRGLKIADFNEDGNVTVGDCFSIGNHSFTAFPNAFKKLSELIRGKFTANPKLLKSGSETGTAGPVEIEEVIYDVDGKITGRTAHVQIGWSGNAFKGSFTVAQIPGKASAKFPFAATGFSYSQTTDPLVTGDKFLPNLGPAPHPTGGQDASAFPELYRSDTSVRPDGTLLGRLKRVTVQAYQKCNFTGTNCYPVGDPWGIGILESIESGKMGQLPLYGDVDGINGFNQKDLDRWDEIKALNGFILSTVYQHPIGVAIGKPMVTDLDREFRVIACGKFSAYPGKDENPFVLKESYNYKFLDPTIWAYDPKNGNQMSFGRRFTAENDTDRVNPPPYPPVENRLLPTAILGPDDIPEDIPHTWQAPGVEPVVIKPGTWVQTWAVTPGGGTGAGGTLTYEFMNAGRYIITHTVKYTQRIVTPVTDGLGIIVYYAVTDIPQTRTLSLDVRVFDHDISDFDHPIFTLKGPGNQATYAPQWGSDASKLRERDFPAALKSYPETSPVDTRKNGVPAMYDNQWYTKRSSDTGQDYLDHQFDIVNADPARKYHFDMALELKFARKVTETSDLNRSNALNTDDLEAYSGVLLSDPIKMTLQVNQVLPDGGARSWKTFTWSPDLSSQGSVAVDPSSMGTYMVKVGGRYLKLQTARFSSRFTWDLPVPTFPNEGYETLVTLTYTKRDFYVDHPSQAATNQKRFGSSYGSLSLSGDGTIKYLDRLYTYTWRRKSLTVDITPPVLASFEEHDGLGGMVPVSSGLMHGTTGDQSQFRLQTTDDHPGYGPNDGLKDGGTRRVWYPRFWIQSIDAARGRFTALATQGYEFPLIVPSIKSMLSATPDGNLAPDLTNLVIERVDGHRLGVVEPAAIEKLGARDHRDMTVQVQFSNYIAGKIAYVLEVEDGSRNFTRQEGSFRIVDNKRPNIDLRLATAKYKPLPGTPALNSLSDILGQVPLGPAVSPFGNLTWAPGSPFADAIAERTKPAADGLLTAWRHPYRPDLEFGKSGFTNRFSAPGYTYRRDLDLEDPRDNFPITARNDTKWDDPVIPFTDKDIKAAFQIANPDAPGFAEDELLIFDLSVRDNLLFWQDDSIAPNGRIVADQQFRRIAYTFLEDAKDERNVGHREERSEEVVKSLDDKSPLRLVNADGTPLSYIYRVGNANATTGLRNGGGGPNTGSNTFRLETVDLGNNHRDLTIDFPIIPSRFQIRVLESGVQADRK